MQNQREHIYEPAQTLCCCFIHMFYQTASHAYLFIYFGIAVMIFEPRH